MPGAKEWELKEKVGKNYEQVLAQLNTLLSELDLEIKRVTETSSSQAADAETAMHADEARYYVTLKGSLGLKEAKMIGWRIDNLAALSGAIAYLVAKQGKAPRDDVEKVIGQKYGRWKAATLVDVFLRSGYLEEDDAGVMAIGWRTKSEVNLPTLMTKMTEGKA